MSKWGGDLVYARAHAASIGSGGLSGIHESVSATVLSSPWIYVIS